MSNAKNKNSMMFQWKKRLFPLCTFSISKCLPTANPTSPPHRLSDDDEEQCRTTNTSSSYYSSSSSSAPASSFATKNFNALFADDADPVEADFATVFASRRFFFSSPGSSNSIVDEPRNNGAKLHVARRRRAASFDSGAGAVEVRKYSVDPRVDFRRSMQEMIDARNVKRSGGGGGEDYEDRSDLEYLHELLLCFLSLNPKDTHQFVISAFTDIVVEILSSPASTMPENHARRHREVKIQRKRNAFRRLSM